MLLLSVHVPKTGGTALRAAMRRRYRVQPIYRNKHDPVDDPQIVMGHVPVSEMRRRWPDIPVVAFIRDPYQQVRSNYDHYLRHPDTRFQWNIGRLPEGLAFEEFIQLPRIRNYQRQFVDERPDFVGTNENLAAGVAQVNRRFGMQIPKPRRRGVTPHPTPLTVAQRKLIEQLHGDDLELYRSVA